LLIGPSAITYQRLHPFADCRYVGQVGNLRPIVNRPVATPKRIFSWLRRAFDRAAGFFSFHL